MLKWHLIRCNQNRIVSPVFLMKSIASEKIMVVFGSKPISFILSFGSTWTPHRHFWGTLGYKKTHPINKKGNFFGDRHTTIFFEKKWAPSRCFWLVQQKPEPSSQQPHQLSTMHFIVLRTFLAHHLPSPRICTVGQLKPTISSLAHGGGSCISY